jgi:hypothetical protein
MSHEAKVALLKLFGHVFEVHSLCALRFNSFVGYLMNILVEREEFLPMVSGVLIYGNNPLNTRNNIESSKYVRKTHLA